PTNKGCARENPSVHYRVALLTQPCALEAGLFFCRHRAGASMTDNTSTTQRLAPGQSWVITDHIGVNFVQPAPGQSVVSFNNAGTILINASSPFIVAGINYDYGSLDQGSVFTNEATGVIRINSTGG